MSLEEGESKLPLPLGDWHAPLKEAAGRGPAYPRPPVSSPSETRAGLQPRKWVFYCCLANELQPVTSSSTHCHLSWFLRLGIEKQHHRAVLAGAVSCGWGAGHRKSSRARLAWALERLVQLQAGGAGRLVGTSHLSVVSPPWWLRGGQDIQTRCPERWKKTVSGGSHIPFYDLLWEVMPAFLLHAVGRDSDKGQPRLRGRGNRLHVLMANGKVLEDHEGLRILQWVMPVPKHSWLRLL